MSALRTSIVILAYGDAGLTERCVASLRETVDASAAEMIVFDNGSEEYDARCLRELYGGEGTRLVRSARNLGFAAGCNAAAAEAGGEVLVFLNNDVEATAGWLEPLLEELDDQGVAIAGSLLIYPNGTVQHAGTGLGLWGLPAHLGRDGSPEDPEFTRPRRVLAVTGACLAIRADSFRELDGFDERYYFSYEDVDLCLRARRRSRRTRFRPESRLIHHESATSTASPVHRLRAEAEEHFMARWSSVLEKAVGRELKALEGEGIRRVAIFGTGRAGRRMRGLLERLTRIEVAGFVDSRPEQAGGVVDRKPVWAPDRLPQGLGAVLGASIYVEQLRRIADAAGIGDLFRTAVIPDIDDGDLSAEGDLSGQQG